MALFGLGKKKEETKSLRLTQWKRQKKRKQVWE